MTTAGRPSWLDRAVVEALAVCPTMQPWEVRVMLIAAAPTIQNAATEAAVAEAAREFESGNDWCQRALAAEDQVAAVLALADRIERADIYDDHDHCVAAIRAAVPAASDD